MLPGPFCRTYAQHAPYRAASARLPLRFLQPGRDERDRGQHHEQKYDTATPVRLSANDHDFASPEIPGAPENLWDHSRFNGRLKDITFASRRVNQLSLRIVHFGAQEAA